MAECRERVGKGTVTFQCSLDQGHQGPCMAVENPPSVSARTRWESGAEARAVLAGYQGRPMTFAENVGETVGTPVPGSKMQPAEYRRTNPESASPPERNQNPDPASEVARAIEAGERELATSAPVPTLADTVRLPDAHEQQLPVVNERRSAQRLLMDDIEARIKIGVERYGTELQPFNGRDAFRDLFEEGLDMVIYMRQLQVEREEMAAKLRDALNYLDPLVVPNQAFQAILEVAEWLEI